MALPSRGRHSPPHHRVRSRGSSSRLRPLHLPAFQAIKASHSCATGTPSSAQGSAQADPAPGQPRIGELAVAVEVGGYRVVPMPLPAQGIAPPNRSEVRVEPVSREADRLVIDA